MFHFTSVTPASNGGYLTTPNNNNNNHFATGLGLAPTNGSFTLATNNGAFTGPPTATTGSGGVSHGSFIVGLGSQPSPLFAHVQSNAFSAPSSAGTGPIQLSQGSTYGFFLTVTQNGGHVLIDPQGISHQVMHVSEGWGGKVVLHDAFGKTMEFQRVVPTSTQVQIVNPTANANAANLGAPTIMLEGGLQLKPLPSGGYELVGPNAPPMSIAKATKAFNGNFVLEDARGEQREFVPVASNANNCATFTGIAITPSKSNTNSSSLTSPTPYGTIQNNFQVASAGFTGNSTLNSPATNFAFATGSAPVATIQGTVLNGGMTANPAAVTTGVNGTATTNAATQVVQFAAGVAPSQLSGDPAVNQQSDDVSEMSCTGISVYTSANQTVKSNYTMASENDVLSDKYAFMSLPAIRNELKLRTPSAIANLDFSKARDKLKKLRDGGHRQHPQCLGLGDIIGRSNIKCSSTHGESLQILMLVLGFATRQDFANVKNSDPLQARCVKLAKRYQPRPGGASR